MKRIAKFMTVALAVGALSSCTDELVTNSQQVKEGDLTGYLKISDVEDTRVAYAPGAGYVWDELDAIKVYTVDQLLYNNYNLISGEGTTQGEFKLDGSDKISGSSSKKYAVTEPKRSNTIYGISATDAGTAFLTATVKPRYDWSDVIVMGDGTEKEAYKLPTPFWGEATIKSGGKIDVAFQALTSFIKLDLRRVPLGTQAIVVTTHEDYYTVAPKGDPLAVLHTGGGNEALAGTMNAELVKGAALAADPRLVSHDTLRIDFDKVEEIAGQDKIIYLAVPAQHYDKLDVLAITTDNRAPYTWTEADVLATFTDEIFEVGKTKAIYQDAEYDIFATDPLEISTIIAQRYDGNHDVRVRLMNPVDAGTLFILNNGQEQGLAYTNVEITFAQDQVNNIDIVECPANIVVGGAGNIVQWLPSSPYIATPLSESMDAKQTVKLNFENGSTATDINLYLPESDIVLSSGADFDAPIDIIASRTNNISGYENEPKNQKKAGIVVKGGNKFNLIDVRATSEKTAVYAYEDNTEILNLVIEPKQPGSIRLTDALAGVISFTATDITGNPAIFTTGAAAIKRILGDQNKIKVHAFWTMKSLTDYAVQNGYEGAQVSDDENLQGVVYTAAQLQAMGLDRSLAAAGSAFTSGGGVLRYFVSKKVGFIWLGGQEFPWIGPQIGRMLPDKTIDGVAYSNRQLVDPDFTLQDPYDTQELGGAVSLDFNWVELRNMELTINDPYFDDPHKCCTSCGEFVVKVERDLGLVRNINTTSNAVVRNVRLNDVELICPDPKVNIPNVGSIVGRISADNGVRMNDNRVTNLQIGIAGGNVGGHVGNILTENGSVSISNVLSGQYSFKTGTFISEKPLGWGKYNESGDALLFVETVGENAGGLVGQILAPAGRVQISSAHVGLNWIASFGYKNIGGNNAGGLVGNLAYGAGTMGLVATSALANPHARQFIQVEDETNATVLRGDVDVDFILTTQAESAAKRTNASGWGYTGNNAGGFAGKAWAAQLSGNPNFDLLDQFGLEMVVDGTVNAQGVIAENRYAGGLIGYNKQAEAAVNDHIAATFISSETDACRNTTVNITAILTGYESVTGGLVGQQVMGDLVIGGGAAGTNQPVAIVEVNVATLATSFAGGGLVGQNLDDVDINTKYRANEGSNQTGKVIAKVTNWVNTWEPAQFTGGYAGETPSTLRMFCGSFDNLGGLVSEHFKVKNTDGVETNGRIPNATKAKLLFKLHKDPTNTKGIATDPYWGDWLGYVGYADQTSFYLIDGSDQRQGDQQFNYRYPYGGGYDF